MFLLWGIIVSFLSGATSMSFAAAPEQFKVENKTGLFRQFYLYSSTPHPRGLVVMLHGCKTNAAEFDQGTEMSKYGAKYNLAVLYPEQSIYDNIDKCWNWFWGTENEIIAEGIRLVQNRYGLNRNNTFLMGMSAGAAQGSIMANEHRDLFSAALLHSGLQYLAATNLNDAQASLEHGSFTPYRQAARIGLQKNSSRVPIQFMVVYGDQDKRVDPKNSIENANELLELNRLIYLRNNATPMINITKGTSPAQGVKLGYFESYLTMNNAFIGSVIQVNGLVHEWSGGNPIQPRNNPNGPKVVDRFFTLLGIF
jgi:poly(hydroxyalkanoate) depolymerase family esterase